MDAEKQLEILHDKYSREINIEKSKNPQNLETRIRQSCYRKIIGDIELAWAKGIESTSSLPIGDVGRSYFPKCTRVEVIDKGGRAYVNYDCTNVEAHIQDDDRTLKVIVV